MNQQIKTSVGVIIIIIVAVTIVVFAWKVAIVEDIFPGSLPQEQLVKTNPIKVQLPQTVGIKDKITISNPQIDSAIASPILVSGKTRGIWFSEGSFPVEVYDSNNKLLGLGNAEFAPQSENETWMTEEFVDFKGEITFSQPETETGYILFKKDNPSDQRELDESFKLPVKFSKSAAGIAK